jgi:hypothetical protein
MRIQLKIWRQESQAKQGRLLDYSLQNVTPDMFFICCHLSAVLTKRFRTGYCFGLVAFIENRLTIFSRGRPKPDTGPGA